MIAEIVFSFLMIFNPLLLSNASYSSGGKYIDSYKSSLPTLAEKTTGQNNKEDSLNVKIANAYGIGSFPKVKSITYTFNVQVNGKNFSRKWQWNPNTKDITYRGKDSTGKEVSISYNRNKPMDEKTKKIDAGFINDNYWLLFPFHLVWDSNVNFVYEGVKKYPIGSGEGKALLVKYSDKVGYTPGDWFELFLDKNNMIRQWNYMHSGDSKNPRPALWEGNKNFGGITISTLHSVPGNKFKLWFSDVKVEY